MCGFKQCNVILPYAILLPKCFNNSPHYDNLPFLDTLQQFSKYFKIQRFDILHFHSATMSNMS